MHSRDLQVINYVAKWWVGSSLSKRERQVFAGYYVLDWSNARIADCLGISSTTVRGVKKQIGTKLESNPNLVDNYLQPATAS